MQIYDRRSPLWADGISYISLILLRPCTHLWLESTWLCNVFCILCLHDVALISPETTSEWASVILISILKQGFPLKHAVSPSSFRYIKCSVFCSSSSSCWCLLWMGSAWCQWVVSGNYPHHSSIPWKTFAVPSSAAMCAKSNSKEKELWAHWNWKGVRSVQDETQLSVLLLCAATHIAS